MKGYSVPWASISAVLLAACLSGCATSMQGNNLSAIKSFPEVYPRKSVSLDLAFTGKLNGKPWTVNDAHNTEYLKNLCIIHLQESDMFRVVISRRVPLDLEIKVAIINEKTTNSNRQILTALTLFIVPYKSTDTFQLLAEILPRHHGGDLQQRVVLGIKAGVALRDIEKTHLTHQIPPRTVLADVRSVHIKFSAN